MYLARHQLSVELSVEQASEIEALRREVQEHAYLADTIRAMQKSYDNLQAKTTELEGRQPRFEAEIQRLENLVEQGKVDTHALATVQQEKVAIKEELVDMTKRVGLLEDVEGKLQKVIKDRDEGASVRRPLSQSFSPLNPHFLVHDIVSVRGSQACFFRQIS